MTADHTCREGVIGSSYGCPACGIGPMTADPLAIQVPWTPGRGVSRESALENEVRLLRAVVREFLLDDWSGLDINGIMQRDGELYGLTGPQVEAVRRALGERGCSCREPLWEIDPFCPTHGHSGSRALEGEQ